MRKLSYLAILLITWTLGTTPMLSLAQSASSTWVFMAGSINRYGSEGWVGWCGAWAEIDQWAEVLAFWQKFQVLPIPGNYTFNYARLANASIIKLDYLGKDFYILGKWDVLKITLVYGPGGNITKVIEILAADAPGELFVTGGWKDFTINIIAPGIQLITGTVFFYRIVSTRPIPKGDVRGPGIDVPDGKINLYDLVHVAKGYGSTPGKPEYKFDTDFNADFTIDIYDLTTLAASLGESY